MIKQNPMNEIVKVQRSNGDIEIVEMAPSQIAEFTREIFEGVTDRKERRVLAKRLYIDREVFTLSNGIKVKVVNHTKMASDEKPYYPV